MLGFSRPAATARSKTAKSAKPAANEQAAPAEQAIPVCEESHQDRGGNVYFAKGQYLARQDRWDMLGRLIAETDRHRAATLSGVSMAALLADGARADAVHHARSVVSGADDEVPAGIRALDDVALDHAGHWGVALVVARAQIECAWAFEGQVDPYALPARPNARFLSHFAAAADLVKQAQAKAPDSAELAATRCDLLAADPSAKDRLDARHLKAIDLDAGNPGRLRAYGVHLLPRWFGTHARLDQTARDVMRHCAVTPAATDWGDGAYTWMWFDALRLDPSSAAMLDAERFVAGMRRILSLRSDPHMANLMAAYADGMAPDCAPDDLCETALQARARIHATLPNLMERHLSELHPQVWARSHALPGAAHTGPLSQGRLAAATAQARAALETAAPNRRIADLTGNAA